MTTTAVNIIGNLTLLGTTTHMNAELILPLTVKDVPEMIIIVKALRATILRTAILTAHIGDH
jgi:hypothetical protein